MYVGGPRLLEFLQVKRPPQLAQFAQESGEKGQSVVYLVRDESVVAAFALADVIRDESGTAVRALHDLDVEVAMLTGDSQDVAKAVADELGIDQYFAEVLPADKDQKVIELQKRGQAGRHGWRRRQRCPCAHPGRYRHRHRQRHRCGGAVGWTDSGEKQPAGCGEDPEAQPGQLPQAMPEYLVGSRVQHRHDPPGGRNSGPLGIYYAAGVGCVSHVNQHHYRGHQCPDVEANEFRRVMIR